MPTWWTLTSASETAQYGCDAIATLAPPPTPYALLIRPTHDGALAGLKFATALPVDLARATLAARLADRRSAQRVLTEKRTIIRDA